jgi:hypothetical protein
MLGEAELVVASMPSVVDIESEPYRGEPKLVGL